MNKKNAVAEGLSFTGLYSSNKEEFLQRMAEAKKSHPKARILTVWEPANKLSRSYCSGGGGWAAYADAKYFAYNQQEEAIRVIASHESIVELMKMEYEKAIEKEKEKVKVAREKMEAALKILNS